MKANKLNGQLKMFQASIDWWREESLKTSFEVEEINSEFEEGSISEEEVLDKLSELNNRMDYLYRKGFYEKRNLFEYFQEH
jgi:hypothetical protein